MDAVSILAAIAALVLAGVAVYCYVRAIQGIGKEVNKEDKE